MSKLNFFEEKNITLRIRNKLNFNPKKSPSFQLNEGRTNNVVKYFTISLHCFVNLNQL